MTVQKKGLFIQIITLTNGISYINHKKNLTLLENKP
jgi:hypothetical protein